jgi:integrase
MDPLQQRGRPVKGNGFHDRIWQPAVKRTWSSVDEEDPTTDKSVRILRPRIHDLRHTCATWPSTSRPDARLSSSRAVSALNELQLGYVLAI